MVGIFDRFAEVVSTPTLLVPTTINHDDDGDVVNNDDGDAGMYPSTC